jgi:hypothetical protein
MNVAQEIVARLYVAVPEVSEPPELTGPLAGVANPAGKSDSGSSTDSSCVPVSWPDAAGNGGVDAVGSAPGAGDVAAGAGLADAEPAGTEPLAAGDRPAADVAELPGEEHPVAAASTPATAASAARAGRTPRTATDDTALPTSHLGPDT